MLAKLTRNNRLTFPKELAGRFPDETYFEVSEEAGRLILTPVKLKAGDAVRVKLAELGIDEKDVSQALRWARRRK